MSAKGFVVIDARGQYFHTCKSGGWAHEDNMSESVSDIDNATYFYHSQHSTLAKVLIKFPPDNTLQRPFRALSAHLETKRKVTLAEVNGEDIRKG